MNAESQKTAVVFCYLWDFLIHHYPYLGLPTLVGEHLKQVATIDGQIVACKGILICDFWGAYNKISALAKQRCFYHLFTELVKVDKRNGSANWKGLNTPWRILMSASDNASSVP